MSKGWSIAVIIMGIVLVAAAGYGVITTVERNALDAELTSVKSTLASTQAELAATRQTLASTQTELTLAKQSLVVTQAELGLTKNTLTSTQAELEYTEETLFLTQSELGTTKAELGTTQWMLTSAQEELGSTQQTLATAQATLWGLGITLSASDACYDVNLVDNPEAANPTWSELMTFLSEDRTEQHNYVFNVYDCSQYSRDVHNNAEAAGIRAAEVQIFFNNQYIGHALNAFLTTDYGLVYVDCTQAPDRIARVEKDKFFRAVAANAIQPANVRNNNWWDTLLFYYYISSAGSVANISIYW